MAAIPGTILAAKISPGDSSTTFPTHEDTYGLGGLRTVSTFSDLTTAIPIARQKKGMIVYVENSDTYYSLSSLSFPLTSFFPVGSLKGLERETWPYLPLSGGEVEGSVYGSVFVADSFISTVGLYGPSINGIRVEPSTYGVSVGDRIGEPQASGTDAETGEMLGARNTIVGYGAGQKLTTGYQNTFIGTSAGYCVLSGSNNIAIGQGAFGSTGTGAGYGKFNVALGTNSLAKITRGSNNIAIGGLSAGVDITTGNNNIVIGYKANTKNDVNNNIVIGDNAYSGYSNTVVLGSSAVATANNTVMVGTTAAQLSATISGGLSVDRDLTVKGTTFLGGYNTFTRNQSVSGTVFISQSAVNQMGLEIVTPFNQWNNTTHIKLRNPADGLGWGWVIYNEPGYPLAFNYQAIGTTPLWIYNTGVVKVAGELQVTGNLEVNGDLTVNNGNRVVQIDEYNLAHLGPLAMTQELSNSDITGGEIGVWSDGGVVLYSTEYFTVKDDPNDAGNILAVFSNGNLRLRNGFITDETGDDLQLTPSNHTLNGSWTADSNFTVNGSTTLGNASGDLVTINAGTVTAPNANGTNAADVANVGTLDRRYHAKMVTKVLTAFSFICNNSTTLVDTPLAIALKANTRYQIEVYLSSGNNGNVSGNKYKINYSASFNSQGISFVVYRNNIGSLSSDSNNGPLAGATYSFPTGQSSSAVTMIHETIYTTSSGTATVQAAQNIADPTDQGLRAGSYIRAIELP